MKATGWGRKDWDAIALVITCDCLPSLALAIPRLFAVFGWHRSTTYDCHDTVR